MKLTELTQAQWDMIPGHIQEYIDMAKAPIDHEKAKLAINELYAMCGKKPPLILHFDNPIHCKIIERIFLSGQLSDQLYDQLSDQLRAQLKYFWLNIWWLYLAGWYSFLEKRGIQFDTKKLNLFRSYCENTCFCIPFENVYIYSEKPIKIFWDENKRLHHNEAGASVEFSGGYNLWSWHGVTVTEKIIMHPDEITVEEIQKENNAEKRRIMLERFGPSKFFMETGAKIIDADYLNLIGSSTRALIEDKFGDRWLIASDGSTSRVYNLPMNREVKSCREAHEQICGFSEKHLIAEA